MPKSPNHRRTYNRRDFMKIAGVTAVGAGLAGEPSAGAQEAAKSEALKATVGIAKSPSVGQAVRDAVELSGGLDFIKPGQRILIKPNQTGPVKHPAVTNPEVLYEVIKLVADSDCGTIFLSDRCFQTFQNGLDVMKRSGHYDAAKQAESELGGSVEVIPVAFHDAQPYLKPGSPIWRDIHHPLARHYVLPNGEDVGFRLAELLFQVDHVINVPCCKVHNQAWFTMSMKAFVGMSDPATTRQFFHRHAGQGIKAVWGKVRAAGPFYMTEAETTPISQFIAELNLGLAPSLNIIDATQPIYAGGHITGESAKADIIIASRDRIAADITGISLLRTLGAEKRLQSMSPWKLPMIRHARKLGLGVKRRSDLTVMQRGVDNIETILEQMA